MRTTDVIRVSSAVAQYADEIDGFYPEEWLGDEKNIALINSDDDVALFEYVRPGVYYGHYFFWNRGKHAIAAAEEFLREIFTYDIRVLEGLTPITNLGARWMSKRLGFKSLGIIKTPKPHLFMMMTREEWNELYG